MWRNSIPIPVGVPVAFKYIEEADDGSLVGWGEDVAGGCNLTVTVEPDDQLISGYRITLLPDTPTGGYVLSRLYCCLPSSARSAAHSIYKATAAVDTNLMNL